MDYRNQKHSSTDESPAKLFFGRSIRTRFDLIKPTLVKERIVDQQLRSLQIIKVEDQ